MNRKLKPLVVFLTVFALVVVPCATGLAYELDQDDDLVAGKMAADALVVRPLGLCATVIGGALFIISLPFSALGGNTQAAFDYLVEAPFTYTFNRPLGEF